MLFESYDPFIFMVILLFIYFILILFIVIIIYNIIHNGKLNANPNANQNIVPITTCIAKPTLLTKNQQFF
jgi:hypothetical protein